MPLTPETTWPDDPASRVVARYVDWERVSDDAITSASPIIIAQLKKEAILALLNRFAYKFELFSDDLKQLIMNRVGDRIPSQTLLPVVITSVADRMNQLENVRATIPVEKILNTLMLAAATGEMDGAPVKPADRIKILMYLSDKVLPEAKSVDTNERSTSVDRMRRRATDFTQDELRQMTRQELLDLMADTRQSNIPSPETDIG